MASASIASGRKAASQSMVKPPGPKDVTMSRGNNSSPSKRSTVPSEPQINPNQPPSTFYSKAKEYWTSIPATVDGMLGGYSSLNVPDIEDSHAFLDKHGPPTSAYALDCGSGIGRVTKQLLLPRFEWVDMVELNQTFLDQTKEYLGEEDFKNIGERFCIGLQDFTPPHGRYDLIWIQWVLGHLTDITLVAFLQRCAQALSADGVIVVKENVTSPDPNRPKDEAPAANFDDVDSSFTRSRKALAQIFQRAGLQILGEQLQTNFPQSIYPVRMFALKPLSSELIKPPISPMST